MKNQKANASLKFKRSTKFLSGRRKSTGYKVKTFKKQYGKATKSFDAWFRSNYGQ